MAEPIELHVEEVITICRRATAHNYGECIQRWEPQGGGLRVWLSSWPRMQEAKRALVGAGFRVDEMDEGFVSLLVRAAEGHQENQT